MRLGGAPLGRRLRLLCGLVLFTYVTLHLTDHALGNVSIAAMDAMLRGQKWVWQGPVGTVALYGALLVHGGLGLWSLYARRYVGWTGIEVAQLLLGLLIPPMLANHVTVTRLTLALFGNDKAYPQELHALWVASPAWGLLQLAVLVVAWSHAGIGIFRAASLRAWFPRWRGVLLVLAVLIPVLAMLGFAQAVREERRIEAASGWHPLAHRSDLPEQAAELARVRDGFLLGYGGLVAAILAARLLRRWDETRRRGVSITYPDGRVARAPAGMSVLDASRMIGVRHASVCGGRGRCSTCRVRVRGDAAHLPEPSAGEGRVLAWVGLDPAFVRLACQLRPRGDIAVVPLVPPENAADYVVSRARQMAGEERFVVAMFVDMRDSTRLAETRMPYDSMFLVGRFVSTVARVVVEAGGVPNQFTGDGVFALFGLGEDEPAATACHRALDAVGRISAAVAALARVIADGADPPLRCGIGVQCGRAVVGEVGFGRHVTMTALGDVVNVAARLEALTRQLDCEAIVAEAVYGTAGAAPGGVARTITLRGRAAPLAVRLLGVAAAVAP